MSSVKETIRSVESRLGILEDLLGYPGDVEFYRVLPLVTVEVRSMFQQGQDYSEQLMKLLAGFNSDGNADEHEGKLRIIMSCYERLVKSLKRLDQLDSFMSELSRKTQFETERLSAIEMKNITQLPLLMNKCHSLLIRSILVAKRFFEMNLRFNEFWTQIDEKIK